MKIKSVLAKPFAGYIYKTIQKNKLTAVQDQEQILKQLIKVGRGTDYGKELGLDKVNSYEEYQQAVPIRDYEQMRPWIDKIIEGKHNVLWKGVPLYFAKTSGTTSGAKYIPITKESVSNHFGTARNAALCYASETGNTRFFDGKLIFLSGSPELERIGNIPTGRLSGISNHLIPKYLRTNQLPSYETNCIEDWETKVNAIVEETFHENMTVISGIPSWVQMYFEKLQQKGNKPVGEIFKNFNLFIYGGVNYEPYRAKFENLIGRKVDAIELFPASEGFFAYQDSQKEKGMLLLLNSGIFYEFVKAEEFFTENPRRYTIGEVELGVNYVLLLSTNAGLWAYNIGDTVQFTSLNPYRVIVSGRIKHYISAFGEHVIGKEVESALKEAMEDTDVRVNEFTVAPQITPNQGLPYHEWFIEFENEPENLEDFALKIDQAMRKQNTYYDDLIVGNVLRTVVITKVAKNGFQEYMKSIGKLGGQNKLPRLANDRKIADFFVK